MNWDSSISFLQDLLTIAALAGVVWSAFEFVRSFRRKAEQDREHEIAKWRRVSVHKILHSSPNFLGVNEILEKLKSSSFDEDFQIDKKAITERELRVVLLEGIRGGYFQQVWGDTYGVARRDPLVEKAFAELNNSDLLHSAYDLILFARGPLSTAEILERLARADVKESDFEIAMCELISRNLVQRLEDGRWAKKEN